MTGEELFQSLLGISAWVMIWVEILKPFIRSFNLTDNVYNAVVQLVGAVIGAVTVIGGGPELNLLQYSTVYGQINPWLGLAITGAVTGAGAKYLHAFAQLVLRIALPVPTSTLSSFTGQATFDPITNDAPSAIQTVDTAYDGELVKGVDLTNSAYRPDRVLTETYKNGKLVEVSSEPIVKE